jgi:putative ATPase
LLKDRDRIFNALSPLRHHRILIPQANDGLLLWEALRRVPEGLAAGIVDSRAARDALAGFAAAIKLDEAEGPQIAVTGESSVQSAPLSPVNLPSSAQAEAWFGSAVFDGIALREPWRRGFRGQSPAAVFEKTAAGAAALLEKGGTLVLLISPPGMGQRLSGLLEDPPDKKTSGTREVSPSLMETFRGAEESFFNRSAPDAGNRIWTAEALENALVSAGFFVSKETIDHEEERLIQEADIVRWFDREKSIWGAAVAEALGDTDFAALKTLFQERAAAGPLTWKWKSLLIKAVRQPVSG